MLYINSIKDSIREAASAVIIKDKYKTIINIVSEPNALIGYLS